MNELAFLRPEICSKSWGESLWQWSVWPSDFTAQGLTAFSNSSSRVRFFVTSPHLFLWARGGKGGFCVQPCSPLSTPTGVQERQHFLRAEPSPPRLRHTCWAAAGCPSPLWPFTLGSPAQSQLLACPSAYFVGCGLHLSLGFAERGIYLQSYFSSCLWFLYNVQGKKGKYIDL